MIDGAIADRQSIFPRPFYEKHSGQILSLRWFVRLRVFDVVSRLAE